MLQSSISTPNSLAGPGQECTINEEAYSLPTRGILAGAWEIHHRQAREATRRAGGQYEVTRSSPNQTLLETVAIYGPRICGYR